MKAHISTSRSSKRYSALSAAIRKYGDENFVTETLETTTAELIDEREIYYISHYNSTDKNIGYNIALGGRGRSVTNVTEESRKNISKALNPNGITSINPVHDDDEKLIGYRARRKIRGVEYGKYFTRTKYSPDENLKMAEKWLESAKGGNINSVPKYNKNNDLPQNISPIKDKKDKNLVIGYRVFIMTDNKQHTKSFQSRITELPILLQKAIDYKNTYNAK